MLFRSPPWTSAAYWVLALETGGPDPRQDPVLAVGMVPVRGGTIRLREAYRTRVRPAAATPNAPRTADAHELAPRDVEDAPPLEDVLPEVDRRIREGVLVVHHAASDVAFLRRDFRRARLPWPSPPLVDTRRLLLRIAKLRPPDRPQGAPPLELSLARAEHGLPEYQAHGPLAAAVAIAELFLALRLALGARTVRDLRA